MSEFLSMGNGWLKQFHEIAAPLVGNPENINMFYVLVALALVTCGLLMRWLSMSFGATNTQLGTTLLMAILAIAMAVISYRVGLKYTLPLMPGSLRAAAIPLTVVVLALVTVIPAMKFSLKFGYGAAFMVWLLSMLGVVAILYVAVMALDWFLAGQQGAGREGLRRRSVDGLIDSVK